jgi:thioesterase domain-containing protein
MSIRRPGSGLVEFDVGASRARELADPQHDRMERDTAFLDAIRTHRAEPLPGKAVFIEATLAGEFTSFGWRSLVADLELYKVSTDHLGLLQSPAVREVAALIQRSINEAGC